MSSDAAGPELGLVITAAMPGCLILQSKVQFDGIMMHHIFGDGPDERGREDL